MNTTYLDLKKGSRLSLPSKLGILELEVLHLEKSHLVTLITSSGETITRIIKPKQYIHFGPHIGLYDFGNRGYGRRHHVRVEVK